MTDIWYSYVATTTTKALVLRSFFEYLYQSLHDLNVPMSVDLFGMTTTNTDDLNIGQVLENALPYFNYISPMVYPSHYPAHFNGLSNPNLYPYEVVNYSMSRAVERVKAASTTPLKLRKDKGWDLIIH